MNVHLFHPLVQIVEQQSLYNFYRTKTSVGAVRRSVVLEPTVCRCFLHLRFSSIFDCWWRRLVSDTVITASL